MTPKPPDVERFKNPQAFQAAAAARIRAAARDRRQPPGNLRRRFLLQRFLARVFSASDCPWVLKGGTAMAVRLPEARYSRDLDMLLEHDTLNVDWAIANLRASMDVDLGDPLRFQISDPKAAAQGADEQGRSVEIKVAAYIGTTLFDSFSIDLSTRPHLVGEVELLEPQPVIEMAGMKAGPQIAVYPLADQIADKICAMYEVHGAQQRPSTRYRDMVDLVLIATTQGFDAQLAAEALSSEQTRRGLTVATPLAMPSSQWTTGYRSTARDAGLAPALQDAAAALHLCNQCFEPILTGAITAGRWDFTSMIWR